MVDKNLKILVIGGAGFLGKWIVDSLLKDGFSNVAVLDWAGLPLNGKQYDNVAQFSGSFTDESLVRKALKKVDCVIHTASPAHGKPAKFYWDINVDGTALLLRLCQEAWVSCFVYTSSASVVYNGNSIANGSEDELDYCNDPMDAYNETKAEAEKLVLQANSQTFRTCALRPSGIFGPRDRQCVPGFINAAKSGKNKFQIGSNLTLFDYTYVENVAYAHILAVKELYSEKESKASGEAFNITNNAPIGFWDMPKELWRLSGLAPSKVIVIPFWTAYLIAYIMAAVKFALSPFITYEPTFTPFRIKLMQANRYFSTEKAKRLLKYEPLVTLEDGIKITSIWVKEGMNYQ